MEKEKDLLLRLKKFCRITNVRELFASEIEECFPELAESEDEDERTRKKIIALVKKHAVNHERCQMETYLEKQKEQKPTKQEWSEEEKDDIEDLIGYLQDRVHPLDIASEARFKSRMVERLKSLRPQPKQEWSEEDEKIYRSIMDDTVQENQLDGKQIDWLVDIKYRNFAQSHWKPSEEQMEWLESAVRLSADKPHIHGIIISLYEQLKRL